MNVMLLFGCRSHRLPSAAEGKRKISKTYGFTLTRFPPNNSSPKATNC
jgi:hypothetical protein